MSQQYTTKSYSLSALFLVGQLAAMCGAVVGLIGILMLGSLLVALLCLVLCSCGIALARFALRYYRERHDAGNGNTELGLPANVDRAIKITGYLTIAGIVVFGWFMFADKHTAYKAAWPLYGFLFCAAIYMLTFISASSFTAWKVFFGNGSQS